MLLRSNLLSYLLCRADAVSDERSESITKDSGRFPRRTCGSPRNDDFIFPLPSRRSDGKRSAAITSFPQRVFKDLRDFKENSVGTAMDCAVSDERSAAITSFPQRVFKVLRVFKENSVGTAMDCAVSDERSAAITSFPQKVFKDLRDFKDFKKVRFSRF